MIMQPNEWLTTINPRKYVCANCGRMSLVTDVNSGKRCACRDVVPSAIKMLGMLIITVVVFASLMAVGAMIMSISNTVFRGAVIQGGH